MSRKIALRSGLTRVLVDAGFSVAPFHLHSTISNPRLIDLIIENSESSDIAAVLRYAPDLLLMRRAKDPEDSVYYTILDFDEAKGKEKVKLSISRRMKDVYGTYYPIDRIFVIAFTDLDENRLVAGWFPQILSASRFYGEYINIPRDVLVPLQTFLEVELGTEGDSSFINESIELVDQSN